MNLESGAKQYTPKIEKAMKQYLGIFLLIKVKRILFYYVNYHAIGISECHFQISHLFAHTQNSRRADKLQIIIVLPLLQSQNFLGIKHRSYFAHI